MKPHHLLAFACLVQMAAPCLATSPADDAFAAIPSDPKALRRDVDGFVVAIAIQPKTSQFAIRTAPYCPAVVGIDPRYAQLVLARIRAAAAATGKLDEAGAGCSTNLSIVFSEDADALVRALEKREPTLFNALDAKTRSEVFDSHRTLRWWYGSKVAGGQTRTDFLYPKRGVELSNIAHPEHAVLQGSMVIIDVNRASGFPLGTLASVAAMVSFAQVTGTPQSLAGLPSSLAAIDRPGPRAKAPADLTAWDRAYLAALYRIRSDLPGDQQRGALEAAMAKALAGMTVNSSTAP